MDTAKDPVVPASAAMTTAGAPVRDLTPAEIDAFAAAGNYAAISKPHLSPILGRYYERSWSHGEGHTLYDSDGRGFLDFACGIATTSLGHHHPAVTAAIKDQADKLLHICNALGYLEPVGRLAAMLADACPDPLDTVFFGNSGAEAVEAALKLARRVTGRPGFIAFRGAFHGRTFGAASITSSSINYRLGYEPLLPSVYLTPFPSVYRYFGGDEEQATAAAMGSLRTLLGHEIPPSSVAAVIIEPIQGEGGFSPAPLSFLRELRALCDEHRILLICDEIQSGIARTGKMWAFEHAGIVPDVVCVAKALANGMPIGAIVTSRELQERWGVGAHGTTFGGNPVSCAAGVAVMRTVAEQGLVANAAARGSELEAGLKTLMAKDDRIGDVRGRGLMIGVELVKDRATRDPDTDTCEALIQACADQGLLVLNCGTHHNVIRFLPPIDVTADEISTGLDLFAAALKSLPRTNA
ncbi:MAG: aspartate aminotransferase family protein [Candidatus Limnocylindrales bacterium]|jgi:4-aminobutyrate aminotransferase